MLTDNYNDCLIMMAMELSELTMLPLTEDMARRIARRADALAQFARAR